MANIQKIEPTDNISQSIEKINSNFNNLNSDGIIDDKLNEVENRIVGELDELKSYENNLHSQMNNTIDTYKQAVEEYKKASSQSSIQETVDKILVAEQDGKLNKYVRSQAEKKGKVVAANSEFYKDGKGEIYIKKISGTFPEDDAPSSYTSLENYAKKKLEYTDEEKIYEDLDKVISSAKTDGLKTVSGEIELIKERITDDSIIKIVNGGGDGNKILASRIQADEDNKLTLGNKSFKITEGDLTYDEYGKVTLKSSNVTLTGGTVGGFSISENTLKKGSLFLGNQNPIDIKDGTKDLSITIDGITIKYGDKEASFGISSNDLLEIKYKETDSEVGETHSTILSIDDLGLSIKNDANDNNVDNVYLSSKNITIDNQKTNPLNLFSEYITFDRNAYIPLNPKNNLVISNTSIGWKWDIYGDYRGFDYDRDKKQLSLYVDEINLDPKSKSLSINKDSILFDNGGKGIFYDCGDSDSYSYDILSPKDKELTMCLDNLIIGDSFFANVKEEDDTYTVLSTDVINVNRSLLFCSNSDSDSDSDVRRGITFDGEGSLSANFDTIWCDGSATFADNVTVKSLTSKTQNKFSITNDGDATFAGDIQANSLTASDIQANSLITIDVATFDGKVNVDSLFVSGVATFDSAVNVDSLFASGVATFADNVTVKSLTSNTQNKFSITNDGDATFVGDIQANSFRHKYYNVFQYSPTDTNHIDYITQSGTYYNMDRITLNITCGDTNLDVCIYNDVSNLKLDLTDMGIQYYNVHCYGGISQPTINSLTVTINKGVLYIKRYGNDVFVYGVFSQS